MNETYLVHDEISPRPDEIDSKPKSCCICRSTFWFAITCALTFAIIGGSSFLFGPLVLQRHYPLYRFTPSQITVQHYRLRLEPDVPTLPRTNASLAHFRARASLIFNNARRTNQLRLVSEHLNITTLNLTLRREEEISEGNFRIVKVTNIELQHFDEVWSDTSRELCITLKKPLEIGDYLLDVHYEGRFHPLGLDFVAYDDDKYMILMNGASRVFPYFDNDKKVQFEVSLARRTDVEGFSNAAFKEVEPIKNHSGYVWEHFKTTPKPGILPSSLGLVIGDFDVPVPLETSSPVILKLYAPRKYHDRLEFAAQAFPATFEYFERYFHDVQYPLTKLDLLLIDDITSTPVTSKLGLGLITLNSERLLLEVNHDEDRRQIYAALAEAIGLQWLQLQLNANEDSNLIWGFAKYLAYNAVGKMMLYSRSRSEEYFVEHIVEQGLEHGSEHLKMAAVLRMINYTLSEEVFRMGLNKFLVNCNGTNENFWKSAEHLQLFGNANTTGKELLASWWGNPGYPVVTVTRTTGWNLIIEQESIGHANSHVFTIPLSYISQNRRDMQLVLLAKKQIHVNLYVPQDEWLLFNYNRIGYYRVNYQAENWYKLIKQLAAQPSAIPVINRMQLLNDAFALAEEGRLQYPLAFELLNYLRGDNERNYQPWRAAIGALNRHEAVFLDSSEYGIFRKFKIDLLRQLWNVRNQISTELSLLVHAELCRMQFQPCEQAAKDFYAKHRARKDVDIPQWVYCTIARTDADAFEFLHQKMKASSNHNDVKTLLRSLTCTQFLENINSLLEETFENINVAKQIWPAMAKSSLGRIAGIMFLELHQGQQLEGIKNSTAKEGEVWKIVIDDFLSTMATDVNLKKMQNMALNLPQVLQPSLHRAMARVNKTIAWTNRHLSMFTAQLAETNKLTELVIN